ncbi:type II toxin-antitoxin system Phd/YefM family antitoxin [Magnetospirillum sp. SS-4]|uniref:type II toxin-antitoxin system Phd/YefM family antitoxin n=1 Tax=Magnetospirillum sp. SS-4 TaxID=2681465 RepID=UPI0020C592C6|nr:type II toxin-antitoxin system Phd/YefM family antitoxin [Magnetospirillum sp. SS-4]
MTTFRNHSAAFLQHIHETGRPLILTVNGKAAAVIQDVEAYQRLLDMAALASAGEGIRQGLADLESGQTHSAAKISGNLRAKHDLLR